MSSVRAALRRPQRSLALLVLFGAGCAAARFDGTLLQKPEVAYRIGGLEPGWQQVRIEGNDLAFYRPGHGSIAVNATCKGYEDVPQAALVNHLLFGTTQRAYLLDEEVTLDGRGARHSLIEAELDGVPVRAEIYLLTRAGCVFDLSYVSDRQARGRDQFTRFVHAFRIQAVGRG
jgi:hypothetical protein